jgi:hypothetical protein
LTARVLLICAGAGLVIAFFMPWYVDNAVAYTGLTLLLSHGDQAAFMSATQRILLLMLPMFGAGLLVAGFAGHRIALWVALGASLLVIGGGVYTLLTLFLGATRLGLWIVVGSALMALAVALLTLGRSIRR